MSEELLNYIADFFCVEVDEIQETNDETIELPSGEEYRIFEDWDDARSVAIEDCKNLLACEGASFINFEPIGGIEQFVRKDWFEDAQAESFEFYIDDIRNEWDDEDTTRLQKEMQEADCEDEEEYLDYLITSAGDAIDWFIDNFGKREFNEVCQRECLLDYDKLAEAIVDCDGVKATLATYDGDEICADTFYAYRTN